MFATLSYNRDDDDHSIHVVHGSHENFGGRRPARLACIECRAKKVRCSGDRNGCAKCSALGIRCIFPASSERGTQGKKRARVIQEKRNADDHSTNPDTGSRLVSATDTRDGSIGPDTGAECLPGQTRPSPSDEANSTSALAVKSPQQPASSRCSAVFGTGTNTLAPSLFTDIGFMGNDFLDSSPSAACNDFDFLSGCDPGTRHATSSGPAPQDPKAQHPSSSLITPSPSYASAETSAASLVKSFGVTQQPSCSCTMSAAHLLEEQLDGSRGEKSSMDSLLNILTDSIAQLNLWMDCKRCHFPKATLMVIALIIERLSLQLEKGAALYTQNLRQSTRGDRVPPICTEAGAFGKYQIVSQIELTRVLRVLLSVKCQQLLDSMISLSRRHDGGNEILGGTKERLQEIMKGLSR
ncbi:hypothetical protein F5B18DRAFT_272632 [Nemania serpens]|nr:hypothetical protein F5B18DRAFT_272632 [Nemania serpens]